MKERATRYPLYNIGCALLLLGLLFSTTSLWGQSPQGHGGVDSTEQRSKAREYYYQAVLAQQASQAMEAFDLLRHARALDPTDPDIAYLLGQSYADLGRGEAALVLLEQAYRQDTARRTFAETLSSAYIQAERWQEALQIQRQLLASTPDDDDLRYRLVQLYARTGQMKDALREASILQQKFSSLPEAYGQITRLKIQLLNFAKDKPAIEQEYRAWAERYPEDRAPYYDWMLYLLQDGQYEAVERRLKQDLASRRITSGDASALRIHKYILEKNYQDAEAELLRLNQDEKIKPSEKLTLWMLLNKEAQGSDGYTGDKYLPGIGALISQHPNDLDLLKSYVQLLRYREHYQQAYDLLAPQAEAHPEIEWLWEELFDNAIGLSSDSLLKHVATRSLTHLPSEWRSYIILSGELIQQERYQDAFALLERGAEAIDPKKGFGAARLYGLLADLYAEYGGKGKEARADSLYQLAIEANPQDADVLNNYAYRLAKRGGDLSLAESYASQAIKLSPDVAHILDTYAYILLLRENFTLARLYQRKALQEAGEKASAEMYDHLGDIYLGTGELAEAIEAWQTAQRLDSDKKIDAKVLARKIAQAQKQLKK